MLPADEGAVSLLSFGLSWDLFGHWRSLGHCRRGNEVEEACLEVGLRLEDDFGDLEALS